MYREGGAPQRRSPTKRAHPIRLTPSGLSHPLNHALLAAVKSGLQIVFALLLISGCRPAPAPMPETRPQRIICATPALTEWVFALGAGDHVVGVSDYASYPPAALDLPGIGGWINPNRERLLRLEPDLILTQGEHAALQQFADASSIRFHSLQLDRLQDAFAVCTELGTLLDRATAAQKLQASLSNQLAALRRPADAATPLRTVMLMGRTPGQLTNLHVIGPNTFLDDLLQHLGGTNIFADALGAYPRISREALLVRQPEVILEFHSDPLTSDARIVARADWRQLPTLPAVRANRIYLLEGDHLLIPGPRLIETARAMASALHPEATDE
jgi:ABC-type Fe3+-hydroxamate transport system substrate-binding protein